MLEPQHRIDVDGLQVEPSGLLSAYVIAKRHKLNSIQERNAELAQVYLAQEPDLVVALDLISDNLLDRFGLDLSNANLMKRRDGTLVIIDPVHA